MKEALRFMWGEKIADPAVRSFTSRTKLLKECDPDTATPIQERGEAHSIHTLIAKRLSTNAREWHVTGSTSWIRWLRKKTIELCSGSTA